MALLFAARDSDVGQELVSALKTESSGPSTEGGSDYTAGSNPVTFTYGGQTLAGVLEMPDGEVEATAIFAHCFTCGKDFLPRAKISRGLASRGIDVLIMHSPSDTVVGIENAGEIYSALNHPKSFISLAGADHLLTNAKDAEYVADLIRVWASRVI
jgi:fermentation-respiration switch protein FrsA (DUF1100 family)